MPLPGAYQDISRFTEWSEKDQEAYWKLKEEKRKLGEQRKEALPDINGDVGLSDNDGW